MDTEDLLKTVETLSERIFTRAAQYDRDNAFPAEDFADLRANGLLAASIPQEYGGLGLGIDNGDPLTLWLITKTVARGNPSTGQCFQVHTNMLQLISVLGTQEQKQKYFPQVVNEGAICSGWGSAPGLFSAGTKGGPYPVEAKKVDGGYVINAYKEYCTNAGATRFATLVCTVEGFTNPLDGLQCLIVPTAAKGIRIVPEWWQASGMRATVSHAVQFTDVFVPDSDVLGEPGAYGREQFQARLHPQFASNFVGAAEWVYSFAVDYVKEHHKDTDPYVQHHIARAKIAIELANMQLRHVAETWLKEDKTQAALASNMYRHFAEECLHQVIEHALRACGSRALMHHYPLDRVVRDMTFYMRHENDDAILANIGRSLLGMQADLAMGGFRRVTDPA